MAGTLSPCSQQSYVRPSHTPLKAKGQVESKRTKCGNFHMRSRSPLGGNVEKYNLPIFYYIRGNFHILSFVTLNPSLTHWTISLGHESGWSDQNWFWTMDPNCFHWRQSPYFSEHSLRGLIPGIWPLPLELCQRDLRSCPLSWRLPRPCGCILPPPQLLSTM